MKLGEVPEVEITFLVSPLAQDASILMSSPTPHGMFLICNAAITEPPRFVASLLAVTVASVPAAAQQPKKPNIVVILIDNLGYGELGVYGGGILRGASTPRIDTLASEGMRLLNFNAEAQWTPSRSALMTGRFSIRSGTYEVPLGRLPAGVTQWEGTSAQL